MERRAAACAANEHAACPHRMSGVTVLVRDDQIEPDVSLCQCACHDGCAVAGRDLLPLRDWVAACTCPGSRAGKEQARSLLRDNAASLTDLRRDAERNAADRREAIRAARERSAGPGGAGRSRDDVRRLLAEEYASRGLRAPDGAMLENLVDSITNPGPLGSARQAVRALAGVGHLFRGGIKLLRNVQRVKGPDGGAAYFAPPDNTRPMVRVILYPQARSILTAARGRRLGPDDQFLVWLERPGAGSPDPPVVSVRVEGGRIGELSPDDSESFDYALAIAQARRETLTVLARCAEDPDGGLSVVISPVGTSWWPG